ncbi:MAG: hypothetical protein IPJ65_07735 [Archangiaceae bacterium]|nr:hypothetical protein [Archangiaceae bacterium]
MVAVTAKKLTPPPPPPRRVETNANAREDRAPAATRAPARPPASSFYAGPSARSSGDAHDNKSSPAALKTKAPAAPAKKAPVKASSSSARSQGDAHDNKSSPAALKSRPTASPVKAPASSARSQGDAHDNKSSPATLRTNPGAVRTKGDAHDNPESPAALKTAPVVNRSAGDAHDRSGPAQLRNQPANAEGVNGTFADADGPLYVDGVSSRDVNQGAAGDCTMLAALAGLADKSPQAAKNLVTQNADGTVTVNFYKTDAAGKVVRDPVTIDRQTAGEVYAHSKDGQEQWVSLVEKAYAQRQGGYDKVNNDGPGALFALTGQKTRDGNLSDPQTMNRLSSDLSKGRVVTAAKLGDSEEGLPAGHDYTVQGMVTRGDKTYVQLRNPWGNTAPSYATNANRDEGTFELTTDQFKQHFSNVTVYDPPPSAGHNGRLPG